MATKESRYPISAQRRLLGIARSTYCSMRSRPGRTFPDGNSALMLVTASEVLSGARVGKEEVLDMSKLEKMDEPKGKTEG